VIGTQEKITNMADVCPKAYDFLLPKLCDRLHGVVFDLHQFAWARITGTAGVLELILLHEHFQFNEKLVANSNSCVIVDR